MPVQLREVVNVTKVPSNTGSRNLAVLLGGHFDLEDVDRRPAQNEAFPPSWPIRYVRSQSVTVANATDNALPQASYSSKIAPALTTLGGTGDPSQTQRCDRFRQLWAAPKIDHGTPVGSSRDAQSGRLYLQRCL